MTRAYWNPLFFYISILSLSQFYVVEAEDFKETKIFTCCKFQSILKFESGACGGSPVYEFDSDIFQPEWNLPKLLIDPKNGKAVGSLKAQLVERPPWCKCKAVRVIPLKLRKLDANGTEEVWNYNDLTSSILMYQDGSLSSEGETNNFLSTEQYCLNKLHYINYGNVLSNADLLSLEFVHCAETCLKPNHDKEYPTLVHSLFSSISSSKSSLNKIDLLRTPYCEDLEEAELHYSESAKKETYLNDGIVPMCKKWIPFYYLDDKFLLIVTSKNITTALQDNTYPWLPSLFPNTFCKIRGSTPATENYVVSDNEDETEGKLVKFCLTEISKIFDGQTKLYAILAGISSIFLLFNLAIYFSLRKSLSISGWTEFLYSISLYAYFVISIVGLIFAPVDAKLWSFCYTTGVFIQFFELANGATLVALSFDIFWTFRKFDSDGYTDDPKVSCLRLSFYITFTILLPFSIVAFGIVQSQSLSPLVPSPHYGLLHCLAPSWSFSSYIQFAMQGLNLSLALISAYIILNKKNQTSPRVFKFDVDEDDYVLDPDRLDIFSKLLIFVFVFWLVNFMEFFYEGEIFPVKLHLIGFHLANYSQGIFAFFILICNRRTLRGLFHRDWNLKHLFRHACCMPMSKYGGGRVPNPGGEDGEIPDEAIPLSPLMKNMKTGSIRRSTVRGNAFY